MRASRTDSLPPERAGRRSISWLRAVSVWLSVGPMGRWRSWALVEKKGRPRKSETRFVTGPQNSRHQNAQAGCGAYYPGDLEGWAEREMATPGPVAPVFPKEGGGEQTRWKDFHGVHT